MAGIAAVRAAAPAGRTSSRRVGRPGDRLIGRLGFRVSDDTILRGLKTRARAGQFCTFSPP